MPRKVLPLALAGAALAGLALHVGPSSVAQEAKTPGAEAPPASAAYTLVAPLDQIMYVADEMFYKMEDQLKEGQFRTIWRHSLFLAEVSNVVIHANAEKEWKDMAVRNRDDFLRLAEASKKKDEKEVKTIWTKVEETCDSCHEKFRDV